MYAGTGNLSRTTIIEHLIYISREIDSLVSEILRKMSEENNLPSIEVLDKLYRQDVAITKDRINQAVSRLLEFIASGRMGLIDSKEFFISIAIGLRRITDFVEAASHRMLLARKKLSEPINENLVAQVVGLLKLLEDSLFEISSIIRTYSTIARGNLEMLRSLEGKVDKIKNIEQDADEAYRRLMEELLDSFENNFKAYILFREIIDKLEDAIDETERIALNLRVLALSAAYG